LCRGVKGSEVQMWCRGAAVDDVGVGVGAGAEVQRCWEVGVEQVQVLVQRCRGAEVQICRCENAFLEVQRYRCGAEVKG
jgi:hypothetical protein